jgi:hypothetical protein
MLISCQLCKDEYEEIMVGYGSAVYSACEYYKHLNIILSDFGSVYYSDNFIVNKTSCVIFNNGLICDNCIDELIITNQIRKKI